MIVFGAPNSLALCDKMLGQWKSHLLKFSGAIGHQPSANKNPIQCRRKHDDYGNNLWPTLHAFMLVISWFFFTAFLAFLVSPWEREHGLTRNEFFPSTNFVGFFFLIGNF